MKAILMVVVLTVCAIAGYEYIQREMATREASECLHHCMATHAGSFPVAQCGCF